MPWRWPSLRQPGVPVAVAMARDGLDVAGGEWEVLGGGPDTPFTSLDLSPPPPELPVKILTPDETPYAVVENQTAFLHCRAFGAPAPTVEW